MPSTSTYFNVRDEETDALVEDDRVQPSTSLDLEDDEEFGGSELRRDLEKDLLRKLDARMSILVLIYILNFVRRKLSVHLKRH